MHDLIGLGENESEYADEANIHQTAPSGALENHNSYLEQNSNNGEINRDSPPWLIEEQSVPIQLHGPETQGKICNPENHPRSP
jgi:hypothetical protein